MIKSKELNINTISLGTSDMKTTYDTISYKMYLCELRFIKCSSSNVNVLLQN